MTEIRATSDIKLVVLIVAVVMCALLTPTLVQYLGFNVVNKVLLLLLVIADH